MSNSPTPEQFENTLQRAKNGDLEAQLNIANYYLEGLGTVQNSEQAVYWYQQAAQAGSAHGQYMLAYRYKYGDGVEENLPQALYWFEQSLINEPENPYSAFAIGSAYYEGIGTEKNLEKAAHYFQIAAKTPSHTSAVYYYGLCLFNGYGVAQNEEQGLKFINEAAAGGESEAQEFLTTLAKKPIDFKKALKKLDNLIGLKEVKHEVKRLMDRIELHQLRKQNNLVSQKPDLHLVFLGNPGTGKTTVARILGGILKGVGLLESGHLVETSQVDLISSFIGGTPGQVKAKVEQALGGILFIDEAYTLADDPGSSRGSEAVATLLKLMEDHRDNLVVIVAGYKNEMTKFLKMNPGLSSRFTNIIDFHDFNQPELAQVFQYFCNKEGYVLTEPAGLQLQKLIKDILSTKMEHFGNARFMRNVFRETIMNMATRISQSEQKSHEQLINILAQDIPISEDLNYGLKGQYKRLSYEDAMSELEQLVGLHEVKDEIKVFINRMELKRQREQQGLKDSGFNAHLVFTGNPGTGKTTVARLLGDILRGIGILKTGHVVETSQVDLIAGFVGQTAIQVKKKIEEAFGGILFIDEAYALMNQGGSSSDFGSDAINTLLKLMEDHRDELVVIVAGYKPEMQEFLKSNPGLASRFTNHIEFHDYDLAELEQIFVSLCDKDAYHLADATRSKLAELLAHVKRENASRDNQHFDNGRFVRNAFRVTLMNLANRVAQITAPSKDDLQTILPQDIPRLVDVKFLEEEKRRIGF